MYTVGFPGLGIDGINIDPVAFRVFGKSIAWYGIIITFGIICAFFYVSYRAKQEHIKFDDVLDLAIFCIISAMIGARAYYVLTRLDQYNSFMEMIAIWKGGIAIYGGIIGGAIAALIVAKVKKLNIPALFDALAPGVMLGQIIGRWGNFVNAEAYGYETNLPWGMSVPGETFLVHPTFLYESLWNLVGFILINAIYKRKKYNGQIFLIYMTWYGFGRMFIEGLRTDSLYVGSFRISQVLALVTCVVGIILLVVFGIKHRIGEKNGTNH